MRMLVDQRICLTVCEVPPLEDQEDSSRISRGVTLELMHQRGRRIGLHQTEALHEAKRVRDRIKHVQCYLVLLACAL